MNTTIQQWLNTLVPLPQILGIVQSVLPAFVLVAIMILVMGYYMKLIGSETVLGPSSTLIVLLAAIAGSPWLFSLAGQIADGLVGAVAAADPALSWIVVNKPNDSSLAMDFSKPFGIIAQYVGAKLQPAQGTMPWELNKWADYIMRVVFILLTGLVACVTVFIMEAMLVIQKLILVGSKLLVPVWIAALSLPAAKGSAQTFLKSVVGVMCWPVGWALVHVGTMAAFQALQPPSLNASLGELVLAFSTLAIACLWPVVGTIGAPFLIARMVTSGTNFAADMIGSFASVAGQHTSRGIQTAAPVAGALMGLGLAGAAGSGVGATLGEAASKALSYPVAAATQSAEAATEGRQPISSSRSRGAADAAIGFIKGRS